MLNLFCYTGGFSIYALAGGALSVDSVDSSRKAVALVDRNVSLNGFGEERHSSLCCDAIDYLKSVPEGKWRKTDEYDGWDNRLPFISNLLVGALRGREHLLDLYRKAGLQGEPMALFSALTLGEDSALSPELEDVYAGVGVTHVLALSGMHLTYLVAMLHFVLLRYCRQRVMRWAGGILVLGMIWGYTFLAGIPPSLVRAAVTYSFMQAGALLGRSGFSINSLAVSALLMLCLNPLWLYDVGFQLSFLAMAGILLIYPRCSELPFMQNRRFYARAAARTCARTFLLVRTNIFIFARPPMGIKAMSGL